MRHEGRERDGAWLTCMPRRNSPADSAFTCGHGESMSRGYRFERRFDRGLEKVVEASRSFTSSISIIVGSAIIVDRRTNASCQNRKERGVGRGGREEKAREALTRTYEKVFEEEVAQSHLCLVRYAVNRTDSRPEEDRFGLCDCGIVISVIRAQLG